MASASSDAANPSTGVDTTAENRRQGEPAPIVAHWLNEILAAKKREKDFRKDGQCVLDIYNAKEPSQVPFNILFSNTETLLPALYSAVPRSVVTRRFKDEDPMGKASATAGQRVLDFLLDTNIEGYETFDQGMRAATLDALLPGRGITCVKYDADIGEMPADSADNQNDAASKPEPTPYKESELACIDTRSWNKVFFGYAKKWSKVPWIAYEEHIDRDEAVRLFTEEIAAKINFTINEVDDDDEEKHSESEKNKGERKTACIYQIWDKDGGKKIRYISAQFPDAYLKVEDDPLQLTGFYNCPKPMMFMEKSNDLLPVALYLLYENQAAELNEITRRISRIVKAIKARGIYDSELGDDIKTLFEADDNELVPADKSSSLAAEKGLQNAIWFAPIEQLIAVLMQLYQAREHCKSVIYEITGISDIIRGSSVASETATAQNLKSQWGTLRLKRNQKEVQRYARDLLRMMLEIAATKFSQATWAKMTGLPFLLDAKFNELTQVAQALKAQIQQEQMAQQMSQGQVLGQPPAPPPAPSPSMQQLQQVLQQLQTPKWADILSLLRDDMQRAYRIDIETNSTIEPEAAEDQKNISDMMNAMGQFLNGVGPLVAKGVMPFGVAQTMLLTITRRFRFGTEIEDQIKQMQPPAPEGDGGKAAAAQQQAQQAIQAAEQKAMQSESAMKQMQSEKALAEKATTLQIDQIKLDCEREIFNIEKKAAANDIKVSVDRANEKNTTDRAITDMKNTKFKTENVVSKKADETLGAGVKAMQQIVTQQAQAVGALIQTVAQQSEENRALIAQVVQAVTAPRVKKAKRGKDGKLESVEETVVTQ